MHEGEVRAVEDEEFLDEVFERVVAAREDGTAVPSVEELLAGRGHLRERMEELLGLARTVARSHVVTLPVVPGYTLLAELGRGGMGAVYLAQQEKAGGRRVALKVLPASAVLSSRARERFLLEARAIAHLRHPHVVTLYDVVASDGICAYAMEWVQGASLAQILDGLGALQRGDSEPSLEQVRAHMGDVQPAASDTYPIFVCRIGIAVARALGELHRAGLVHRDVKPSNILLRRDGTALLSDFGLVHAVDESLTQPGFVGTMAYASPEQLGGEPDGLDARSDVYALGVTLYRALTLRLPFDDRRSRTGSSRTPAGMLRLIESGRSVPLRVRNRRLPRDLETIVGKALEVEPARRYASADELADDLERMLSLQPIRARPAGAVTRGLKFLRRHRGPTVGIVAGSVVSLALALAAVVYVFLVPRWVEEHVRDARLALMDPLQANLLFNNVYWGRRWADEATDTIVDRPGLRAAVQRYDSALRLSPFDGAIRLEREVVLAVLDAPESAKSSYATDLRSAGLAAYLVGDVEPALRSWELFERGLDPSAASDPLVETGLGILYLVRGEGARAYPRLRDACQAFPDVGFLTSYLADAALRCGDPGVAERLLDAAARMPRQDPQLALNRIRADLLAAQGRDSEAEALYRRAQPGTPANLHHARFLHSRGHVEEALDQYVVAASAMEGAIVRAEYERVLAAWWAALGPEERGQRIRASVGLSPWDPRSLVARLRYYPADAEMPELAQAQPVRPLESLGLAELARVLDVEDCAHWSTIANYPPLLAGAERWALGSPCRPALSLLLRQLAAAHELVRSGPPERAASTPPNVTACTDAACFRGLGDLPGGAGSYAACLSSDGSTVGGSASAGQPPRREPFVWRAETGMVPLGPLDRSARDWGEVRALSANGSVAVGFATNAAEQAFRWTRGEGLSALRVSEEAPSWARSVSEDGSVVGGQSCAEWRNASTWSADRGWVRLGSGAEHQSGVTCLSRDGRWAAGYVTGVFDGPMQAARWSMSGETRIVVGRPSKANGVSDGGAVVGYFGYENGAGFHPEAMYWTGEEPPRRLPDLQGGALDCSANAVSRDGTWIVGHGTSELGAEAVLWDARRRVYRAEDVLQAAGGDVPTGWMLLSCDAVVQTGDLLTICGNGRNPAGDREAWIARFRLSPSASGSAAAHAR